MATKHICDVCNAEVRSRADLWVVEIRPAEKSEFFDKRRFESFELCNKCKRGLYVQLHEGIATIREKGE